MIFIVSYVIGLAPLSYVVANEISPINLTDYTNRLCIFFNILFTFVVAFTLPYLLYGQYAICRLAIQAGFHYRIVQLALRSSFFSSFPNVRRDLWRKFTSCLRSTPIKDFQRYQIEVGDELHSETGDVIAETEKVESEKKPPVGSCLCRLLVCYYFCSCFHTKFFKRKLQ